MKEGVKVHAVSQLFNSSCQAKRVAAFVEWVTQEILEPIDHRQLVWTIPEVLRPTFRRDRTARVQTINKEQAPPYWNLIPEFGKKLGVPVLLNTSFNVMGEPIVENPNQAIRCFYSSGMDALALGNYMILKSGYPVNSEKSQLPNRGATVRERSDIKDVLL